MRVLVIRNVAALDQQFRRTRSQEAVRWGASAQIRPGWVVLPHVYVGLCARACDVFWFFWGGRASHIPQEQIGWAHRGTPRGADFAHSLQAPPPTSPFLLYIPCPGLKCRCVRAVEKTPRHVRSIAEIFAIRPMASVVLLSRNGLDVAASFVERGDTFGRKL